VVLGLLAALALTLGDGSAARAARQGPHFSAAQAIAVASSDPGIGPIQVSHPGSHWVAVYEAGAGIWHVTLSPRAGGTALASFTIADGLGTVLKRTVHAPPPKAKLTNEQAIAIARRQPSVHAWLGQYPRVFSYATLGDNRVWTATFIVNGEHVAEVHVLDSSGRAYEAWTGPQVGWMMTRGLPDSYGRKVTSPWVLVPMSLLFLAGLINWRRPLSLRTLDIAVLLSFVGSLVFFDRGDVFRSTPLVYPPMLYLIGRMVWIGCSRRPRAVEISERHMLVLIALIFGLMGFRLGLNNQDSNIIDVGYAGVAGASRLLDGQIPYGHMPRAQGTPCGGHYANGDPIGYVQADHRCESPIENGDTYGPVVYLAYVPAVAAFGWSGRWDSLPAAHVAASAFDILAVLGLFVAGWRLASPRLGVLLAFAWAADPFTAYTLNMNANDALVGAAVAWLLAVLSVPAVRGVMLAVAGFTKLGPLAMVPVFVSLRSRFVTLVAFAAASLVLLSMLALDAHGLRLFWDRTIAYQRDRITPMSIWTLGDYHPGWPHLERIQEAAQIVAAIGIGLLAFLPRRRSKDAAAVAALCAAAVIATQLVASYWFYPYICWWLPLVLAGFFLPRSGTTPEQPVNRPLAA
jgi:Glycosyltransferase family 87